MKLMTPSAYTRVAALPASGTPGTVYIVEPGNASYYWNGAWQPYESRPITIQKYNTFRDVAGARDARVLVTT